MDYLHTVPLMSSDIARSGTYLSGRIRHQVLKSTECYTYFTILGLFNYCGQIHLLDYFAEMWAGVAGCTMLPTVVFGFLANTLLVVLLALKKVKRPAQMQTYALWIAIFDALFLILGGYFFAYLTFGRPWWGTQDRLIQQTCHLACKLFNFLFDFLQVGKTYLMLAMVLHVLNVGDRPCMAPKLPVAIWAKISAVLAISVILASPTGLVFGLIQRQGMIACTRDPQWASGIHLFHYYHTNLLVVGLIPNVLTLSLLYLVWCRFRWTQHLLNYLRNIRPSKDPVGLTVCYTEHRQLDWLRNYRILLIQGIPFCTLRIIRCLGRLLYLPLVVSMTNYPTASMVSKSTMTINVIAPAFLELIVSSFPFLIWYVNVPQIRAHCESGWLRFTCRWTPRQLRRYRQRLDPGSYLDQALATLGDRRILRMKCDHVLRQLHRHDLEMRANYDNLGKENRGSSWCDSSTILTTSSFVMYNDARMSQQSVCSELNRMPSVTSIDYNSQ